MHECVVNDGDALSPARIRKTFSSRSVGTGGRQALPRGQQLAPLLVGQRSNAGREKCAGKTLAQRRAALSPKDVTLSRIMELNEALSMMRANFCNKKRIMAAMKLSVPVRVQARHLPLLYDKKTAFCGYAVREA